MAHNSRIRAPGTWTNGTTLLAAELEAFDASIAKQVNGDDGGTWAPVVEIELGGSGLNVTGPCALGDIRSGTLNGTLTVTNTHFITFNSGAVLALLNGAVATMAGNASLTLSGTAAIVLGGTSSFTLGTTATAALNGAITLSGSGALTYNSATTVVYGGHTAGGTITRTGATILSGSTGVIGWRVNTRADSSASFVPTHDLIFCPATLAGNRTWVLLAPTGNVQARVVFARQNAAGSKTLTVQNFDGTTLVVFSFINSPWAEVVFDGTNWLLVRSGTGV